MVTVTNQGKKVVTKMFSLSRKHVPLSQRLSQRYEDEDEEHFDEEHEALSENAEEDRKAQKLMSQEEEENHLFKKVFERKIKTMICKNQIKYILIVLVTAFVISAYFSASFYLTRLFFSKSEEGVSLLDTLGQRGPELDALTSFFLESEARQEYIR